MGGRGSSSGKRAAGTNNASKVLSKISELEASNKLNPFVQIHKLRDEMTKKGMTEKDFDRALEHLRDEERISMFLEDRIVYSESEHKKNYFDGENYYGMVVIM